MRMAEDDLHKVHGQARQCCTAGLSFQFRKLSEKDLATWSCIRQGGCWCTQVPHK